MPTLALRDVTATWNDRQIKFNAAGFQRVLDLSEHGAVTASIEFGGRELPCRADEINTPDCSYDGLVYHSRMEKDRQWVSLTLMSIHGAIAPADHLNPERIRLTALWQDAYQGLSFRRVWILYPGVAAVVSHGEVRSESSPRVGDEQTDFANVVDGVRLSLAGWTARCVAFRGRTDFHNQMVSTETRTVPSDGAPLRLSGGLLFLEPPAPADSGLFLIHEAPPENEKRPECEAAFEVGPDGVRVFGWGIHPNEVLHDRARRGYSAALGAYAGGETGRLEALRRYCQTRFPHPPAERAIVANPWADGNCYERFSEAFILEEIEAAAEIGATHYQIDDGWQAGGVLMDMTRNNLARPPDYWTIDPVKFPNGFDRIAKRAKELGIGLALWFAPDMVRRYRNWEEERDLLLSFHYRYGMDLIKIDGVQLACKEAEENLTRLLTSVIEESGGAVRFNLDVTNGRRLGYFINQRFGSLFMENRYVRGWLGEPRCYKPWRILQNLWRLAHHVPPSKLQFEFLNVVNTDRESPSWDPEAPDYPTKYRWDYMVAVTFMSSPLAWFEPSGLPPEARAAFGPALRLRRELSDELATAFTLPVGDEPSGYGWTGFQSYQPGKAETGLLAVYREITPADCGQIRLHHAPPGRRARLACLSHKEGDCEVEIDEGGAVAVTIPRENDYRLFRYHFI